MSVIVISGANRGIGYFMVEKWLLDGHSVAVLDIETANLDSLKTRFGDHLLVFQCDMRDEARIKEAVREIASRFKVIDVAVHNACRCTFDALETTDEATYRDVFEVNYFGALRLTRAVLPWMRVQRSGRIIFTSSGVGVTGFVNISPYASSKGALESLAKCLRIEYQKEGITFHLMHPPLTRTTSAAPLPVPPEMMADPRKVGYGLAKRVNARRFIITHSFSQALQIRLSYLFPLGVGRLMSKMTGQYVAQKAKNWS